MIINPLKNKNSHFTFYFKSKEPPLNKILYFLHDFRKNNTENLPLSIILTKTKKIQTLNKNSTSSKRLMTSWLIQKKEKPTIKPVLQFLILGLVGNA